MVQFFLASLENVTNLESMKTTNISKEHYDNLKQISETTGDSVDELIEFAICILIDGAKQGSLKHLINQDDD
jgi:hypothetical protein